MPLICVSLTRNVGSNLYVYGYMQGTAFTCMLRDEIRASSKVRLTTRGGERLLICTWIVR